MAVVVFAGFVVLVFAGSGAWQIVGFAGAVVILIAMVGGVPTRGASDGYKLTSTERGRTIAHAEPDVLDETPVDPAAWQRERARRDGKAAPAEREAYNPFGRERG